MPGSNNKYSIRFILAVQVKVVVILLEYHYDMVYLFLFPGGFKMPVITSIVPK